jgi:GntR family transcriptional regulator
MSRAEQVEFHLLADLRRSQPGDRFPSETEIAGRFGVSRVTVREALASLERRGLISRRRGAGTFVNRNALQIQIHMDESVEFGALIAASGHTASLAEAEAVVGPPDPYIVERLKLGADEQAVTAKKVFAADGRPVIYVLSVVPLRLFLPGYQAAAHYQALKDEPLYPFLLEKCGQSAVYQVSEIRALATSREIAGHLGYPSGAPMLNIEEVGYNAGDLPVFYSDQHYNTDIIQFSLLRRPV